MITNSLSYQNFIDHSAEVACQVKDESAFESRLEDLKESFVYPRLNSWFGFFNEHRSESLLMYSNSIIALLMAAKDGRLLQEQTQNEFEISQQFYKTVFACLPNLEIKTPEDAKYLLSISLIFGKFPGMAICSLQKALQTLVYEVCAESLVDLFEKLFVKYEKPTFFIENLSDISLLEIDFLMYILQGNSARLFPKLPLPLSKKENHFFMLGIAEGAHYANGVFEFEIIRSKLSAVNPDPYHSYCFTYGNNYFLHRPKEFYRDIEFWKSATHFTSKIDFTNCPLRVSEFVDYFAFMRHSEDKEWSFKGRTTKSLTAAVASWHEKAAYKKQQELLGVEWGSTTATQFKYEQDSFLFKELSNGLELFQESENMKHCAFSYIENCLEGHTSIWSVKKAFENTFVPHLTMEVQDKSIVQVALKRNGIPSKMDIDMLKIWAEFVGFSLSNRLNFSNE